MNITLHKCNICSYTINSNNQLSLSTLLKCQMFDLESEMFLLTTTKLASLSTLFTCETYVLENDMFLQTIIKL